MASDDVLTEGEIDALMESVDGEGAAADSADDGRYRRFDFGAREQSLLREFVALKSLSERHAEVFTKALESAFSLEFFVRPLEPDLLSVADTLASLERATAVSTCTLAPLPGPVFIMCPGNFLSYVVNAYFGGGKAAPASGDRGALTPTELRVAERVAERQLHCLCVAWADKIPLETNDLLTNGNAERLEMLPGTDLLLRMRFVLCAQDLEMPLDIYMPFADLEPYRLRFAPPKKNDAADAVDSWEPFFRRELPGIHIEIAGVLTTRSITLADLLQLAPGSVIPIPPPEAITVKADETTLAEGRYGSFEGTKAVQLNRLASVLEQSKS